MQEILSKYKDRLINISSRNRSLVMKKLYKKNSFDLFKLNKFKEDISTRILSFLLNREEGKIKLLADQNEFEQTNLEKYKKQAAKQEKEDIDKLQEELEDDKEIEEKIAEVKRKYEEEFKSKTETIKMKIDDLLDASKGLTYLTREINAIEKETGRYELYVGYPFVEGLFNDGTFVKAPLMLFPVKIKKEADDWYIDNIEEQNILLNKVFLMAFTKYNNSKINEIETEFDTLKETGLDSIEGLLKYLDDNGISIKRSSDTIVERFKEHGSDAEINYKPGELSLKSYLVLGRFPVANNSIYHDYISFEKEELDNKLLSRLLINSDDVLGEQSKELEEIDNEEVREEDFYFMTSLDYSQEKAVRMSNTTEQLVIYGPPGTGKSQTIANIISDGLAKGKKILMVSQKRAALDVIYNRVTRLNSKVVIIHDAEKDKRAFYDKVANSLEALTTMDTESIKSSIKEKARKIDGDLKVLEGIGEQLHTKREFGLSLQQMYSRSSRIAFKDDSRYEDFRTFRNGKMVKVLDYKVLVDFIERVHESGLADNYYTFRKYIDNNIIIINLKEAIDSFQKEEATDIIDELLSNLDSVQVNHKGNLYWDRLLDLYKVKENLEKESIINLADSINNKTNKQLLNKINNNKWWSIKYWLDYSKNKKIEEENLKEYEARGTLIKEDLLIIYDQVENLMEKLKPATDVLNKSEVYNMLELILKGESINKYLEDIRAALSIYDEYEALVSSLSLLSKDEKDILKYAYENSKGSEHYIELLNQIPEFLILLEINNIDKEKRLELDKYKDYELIKDEVNRLMKEKQNLIPEFLINEWNNMLYAAIENNKAKEKELRRQATKKRALWPIRKYIGEFHPILFELFPCWLLSPETVSEIIPLKKGIFDLIVFDEASQMFVESAIPSIYRSNSIVVAGDDKQLKPSSTFKVRLEEEEGIEDLETAAALEEESLLDLAKVNYDYVHLNYHYRSKFDELINFSNYAFYNGRLEVSPNLVRGDATSEKAIERIKVSGTWIDRKNKEEAEKVVELVDDLLKNRKDKETIGIITFNVNQKDLIDDMLEAKAKDDSTFKELFYAELQRVENNEDVSLFVKNIENVQGDERDIIIFSTAYAKNDSGKISVNFGSLSQDGGENRLNVAISRAKKKIYVVTSIEPEELKIESSRNAGPKLFKQYLQYVREASEGNKETVKTILNSLICKDVKYDKEASVEFDFETAVAEELRELGYDVDTQIGVSGYKIDIAIFDKKSSRYVLGLECDGASYHLSTVARERDIHRQRYLEARGWKIIKVWSKDWWNDRKKELSRIEEVISEQLGTLK
jgi:superfamily I DNA and/or RNA helicase/very-short-patch-repair endonuclease